MAALLWVVTGLVCLTAPVDGPVTNPFAPDGSYAGHWGVDFSAPLGSTVGAPMTGTVSFAGSVAGMQTVTISTGDFKVSVSYLESIRVASGQSVVAGQPVATSGAVHGGEALHLSVRLGDAYVDPAPFLACRFRPISDALRLVPYPA